MLQTCLREIFSRKIPYARAINDIPSTCMYYRWDMRFNVRELTWHLRRTRD